MKLLVDEFPPVPDIPPRTAGSPFPPRTPDRGPGSPTSGRTQRRRLWMARVVLLAVLGNFALAVTSIMIHRPVLDLVSLLVTLPLFVLIVVCLRAAR
ncbi:MAG: hypothetical protein JOY78_18635 [Pseudonocardia sp.]|nr:hypothetical protein [Pseudonocardia sp.]